MTSIQSLRVIAVAAVAGVALMLAATDGVARASADAVFDPWTESARYEIEYVADLSGLPEGKLRRVWFPLPGDSEAQRVHSTRVDSPWPHRITADNLGNRFVYIEVGDTGSRRQEVTARVLVERHPYRGHAGEIGTPNDPKRFLKSQQRIPLDGLIAQIARQESVGLESDGAKIRAFYDYVVRTMSYSKKGVGWGKGDAIWACTEKYGNCTDFHSLFIGMARSQGIPARFVIGFPIPHTKAEAEVPGYHCWAEVYRDGIGWFPFDASEAKKSGLVDEYFGTIPSDRVEFTTGRDLTLEPAQQGAPVNYFIYPYAEVDGVPVMKLPVRFHFQRVVDRTAMR